MTPRYLRRTCNHSPQAQREAIELRERCPVCLHLQVQRQQRELEHLRETLAVLQSHRPGGAP